MKRAISLLLCAAMLTLAGCGGQTEPQTGPTVQPEGTTGQNWEGAVSIDLSDEGITVDGEAISGDTSAAVYAANDIVYYEEGKDFTYGEGEKGDAHSAEEAAAHTVVTITRPGTYVLSGKLSAGQIAVDLGEDAEDDPNAVVTLVLNQVDITCTVAPAVIFYNVYECGDKDNPTKDVDTSAAGANVIIADGTENNISGSYVARIYKPGTVELSEDGTEVADAKKLHKYDAAFYSKMSMNVSGESEYGGTLVITAENEGLDSEMHLTINSGTIAIASGNDGINTNEDGVSVTTINGGLLRIKVMGQTGEGDGIDSNGWLVINGGTVVAAACSDSADSGIDSDMGIHINGGTVIASGHMLDRISESDQGYVLFNFGQTQTGGTNYVLKDAQGNKALSLTPDNDFSVLLYSGADLPAGDYTLWSGDTQLGHSGQQGGGMMPGGLGGGQRPEGMEPPEGFELPEGFDPENMPEGMEPPVWNDGFGPSNAEKPENGEMPELSEDFDPQNMPFMPQGMEPPEGFDPSQMPGGGRGPGGQGGVQSATEAIFAITGSNDSFTGIGELQIVQ